MEPDSTPDLPPASSSDLPVSNELASAPEFNPVDYARTAYEQMIAQLSGEFLPWDELTPATRGLFKQRAHAVLTLPVFEQYCAKLLYRDLP